MCEPNFFEYRSNAVNYINNNPYDHENIGWACDPHYVEGYAIGPYSSFRRCLYGKEAFEYNLEFGKQFFSSYKNERKVLMLNFMDMHEGTGEVIGYLDKPLSKFLKDIENSDTTFMLYADHGFHLGGFKKSFGGQ